MILQALESYYQRKSSYAPEDIPPLGFEFKEIPLILVIDGEGTLVQLEETYQGEGKKRRPRAFLVPQGVKKTSGVAANLLWDNAEYVLGLDLRDKPERVVEQAQAFRSRIEDLNIHGDPGIDAVTQFLAHLPLEALQNTPQWELLQSNPLLSFRLSGHKNLICQSQKVIEKINEQGGSESQGFCLVSGRNDDVERLHPVIKGVWGAQTSGANIVSFNLAAFTSWQKSQGENAPIGKASAFAYTTALNHLLRKESRQRFQVGDASTVFWANHENSALEKSFALFFLDHRDNPDEGTKAINDLFASVRNGVYTADDSESRFFVLGLAPNASRIAIRFWHVGTVKSMALNIAQYFDELDIDGREKFGRPSLFRLLVSLAVLEKADNIPPNIAGDTMRAILENRPFPMTLLNAAVRRCKATREVSYYRAALIKASLMRMPRFKSVKEKELTMSLDLSNDNIGYRLGRLFATLEKIQEEANPQINATIRDRFYGSASASPVTAFPILVKLKNHHLAKIEHQGRRVNFERLLAEVIGPIQDFPHHLSLADQGRFAIGYYHQRQDFFKSKKQEGDVQ